MSVRLAATRNRSGRAGLLKRDRPPQLSTKELMLSALWISAVLEVSSCCKGRCALDESTCRFQGVGFSSKGCTNVETKACLANMSLFKREARKIESTLRELANSLCAGIGALGSVC